VEMPGAKAVPLCNHKVHGSQIMPRFFLQFAIFQIITAKNDDVLLQQHWVVHLISSMNLPLHTRGLLI
jgi:hypothetical protein